MREEIEAQGGLKLIYIDPPFDVGADFSMDIEIGGDTFAKKPNILEEIAYRDTWGNGLDSFIHMMWERLALLRDLLAEDGSLYLHCDWRVSGVLRVLLDEIFGAENFLNENIWCYGERELANRHYNRKHDTIFFVAKNADNQKRVFNCWDISEEYSEGSIAKYNQTDSDGRKFQVRGKNVSGSPYRGKQQLPLSVEEEHPDWTYRDYLDEKKGILPRDWIANITFENRASKVRTGYPTQKPEKLLELVIRASSDKNDIVLDPFFGTGTTGYVASKLKRKWIGIEINSKYIRISKNRISNGKG